MPRAIAPEVTITTSSPPCSQRGDLRADRVEHVGAQLAVVGGDDRGAQLYDQRHGPASLGAQPALPFSHRLRVRYGECDAQGIVFNANYLAYVDVALTELWREAFALLAIGSSAASTPSSTTRNLLFRASALSTSAC